MIKGVSDAPGVDNTPVMTSSSTFLEKYSWNDEICNQGVIVAADPKYDNDKYLRYTCGQVHPGDDVIFQVFIGSRFTSVESSPVHCNLISLGFQFLAAY